MTYAGPDIVTNGLVLCLDAANRKSYPGTGSTWFDISGSGRNAIKAGTQSPTYPQYNSRGYFAFNGGILSENYSRFEVSNIPSFSALSVFAWYRTADTTSYHTLLRMNNDDFSLALISFQQSNFEVAAGTRYDDVGITTQIPAAVDGNWHNMGLTFDGQNLKGFFDGRQVSSATRGSPTTTAAGTLNIGTRDDAYWQHLVGDIACILLYNRALSLSEIQQNFNANRGRFNL